MIEAITEAQKIEVREPVFSLRFIKYSAVAVFLAMWFLLILQWVELANRLVAAQNAVQQQFFSRNPPLASIQKIQKLCEQGWSMTGGDKEMVQGNCQKDAGVLVTPSIRRDLQSLREAQQAAARSVIANTPLPARWFACQPSIQFHLAN